MSKWEMVELGRICEITSSKRIFEKEYIEQGIPFYRTKEVVELSKGHKISTELFISEDRYKEINKKFGVPVKEDILITAVGTIGETWVIPNEDKFYFKDGNLIWIKKNERIDSNYLSYFLKYNIKYQKDSMTNGSAYKALTIVKLKKILIPLPTIEIQKHITETLDKVSEIIDLHKKRLEELDNLIKTTFYDMFGDPYINEKHWKVLKLGDTLSVLTDYHSNGSYKTLRDNVKLLDTPDYALMIRTTDLEKENFSDDVKYISKHAYEHLEKSKVFGGEIIINKIGSAGKVYLMPYLNRPVSLAMNQFLLRFDNVNEIYAYYYLTTEYSTKNINDKVRGAVTKTITKDAIRDIIFVLPPIELQNKFAQIVTKIEEQKNLEKQAISESENLFNSLMSKYFD
ncbi:restriction endonuclease subunit S [Clostridium sp. 2-1]|uniref:restriction endonuclease subunit S n=1 Tax=Clostridium TaxID=1485 RepID=UPI000CDBA3EB|nr:MULTISPECIES: restriction endonuclease subunit S [Clostridium]MBN7576853.1 restriction endonuclease subunit S [Clostridium beijerinckii]MBN7581340.1 restriction endonuclease subunit S [Clostridium beijerinckii]MBN7586633.1 restriction endonuclease subunit S [Clostridium beijerinckii]MBO0522782.1 restriction endonuclease subunit S [Clostridium beijerinckii]POO89557.1 restriction endonuclease subunit S [Clostridium sp. 2-1]